MTGSTADAPESRFEEKLGTNPTFEEIKSADQQRREHGIIFTSKGEALLDTATLTDLGQALSEMELLDLDDEYTLTTAHLEHYFRRVEESNEEKVVAFAQAVIPHSDPFRTADVIAMQMESGQDLFFVENSGALHFIGHRPS